MENGDDAPLRVGWLAAPQPMPLSDFATVQYDVFAEAQPGSQFTSAAFRLASAGIRTSMDGRGRWLNNVKA